MANPGRADDRTAVLDLHARTDIHRPDDLRAFPVDRGVGADPDAGLDFLAGHGHLRHFTAQHALQYGPIVGYAANIDPVEEAVLRVERQALLGHQGEQLAADVKRDIGRDEVQNARLENIDAGTGQVRFGLCRAGLLLERQHSAFVIGHDNSVVLHLVFRHFERDDAG